MRFSKRFKYTIILVTLTVSSIPLAFIFGGIWWVPVLCTGYIWILIGEKFIGRHL